jgi:hypothetical protein
MIKKMEFASEYTVQIFNFFTDLPLQDIERFMVRNQVDDETLKVYYRKYVREFYPRPELEEMLLWRGLSYSRERWPSWRRHKFPPTNGLSAREPRSRFSSNTEKARM